jgi:hypothetical protein
MLGAHPHGFLARGPHSFSFSASTIQIISFIYLTAHEALNQACYKSIKLRSLSSMNLCKISWLH